MKISDELWKEALSLDKDHWLESIGREKAERAYNGIGADWMSPKVRGAVTSFWAVFEPAAVRHDCEFAYWHDRSENSFKSSNKRFYKNCKELCKKRYKWYYITRYCRLHEAKLMYECLCICGKKAWIEGELVK